MGNIRRSRGYDFEYRTVEHFKKPAMKEQGWDARRLGGSSTGFPDVVALNAKDGRCLVIECKAGQGNELYVPADQVERLMTTLQFFGYNRDRRAIVAFKFISKNKKGEFRKLLEYYHDITGLDARVLKCTYNGDLYAKNPDGTWWELKNSLRYVMPFEAVVAMRKEKPLVGTINETMTMTILEPSLFSADAIQQ